MRILAWMITDEMKLTEHYKMYAERPAESVFQNVNVIHFRLPSRQSVRLTPPVPVPSTEKADEMILQDMIQVSLVEHKSREEQEARENVALDGIPCNLAAEEIEKFLLEPRSDKESPEVEIVQEKEEETTKDTEVEPDKDTPMVDVTNIVPPVNVDDEEDEITDEVFELRRRVKGKNVEETRISPIPSPTRSPRNLSTLVSSDTEKLQELTFTKTNPSFIIDQGRTNTHSKRYMSFFHELHGRMVTYLHISRKGSLPRTSIGNFLDNLHDVIMKRLPQALVKEESKEPGRRKFLRSSEFKFLVVSCRRVVSGIEKRPKEETERLISKAIFARTYGLALQMKFEKTQVPQTACRSSAVRTRDQDDPHDDAHPEGENSNQEQDDEFDFWTDSYAFDDDEIPTKQVTQDIMEEISLTIDEAKLKKMADEMLRQRCTSGDEHQYHIDQMKNFLQSDIVWESRKEILVSPHPRKITPLVQSCQRDPEAPALSLINQDLLYLKKGNSGAEKIVLSLHKFPAIVFNDDDIGRKTIQMGLLWSLSVFIRSLVIWERVHDFQLGIESYQQKINLTAPTITFLGIEEYDVFSIVYEPVHGIIYTNSKKEKRVMRPSEIHKFCDATLRRTLEGLQIKQLKDGIFFTQSKNIKEMLKKFGLEESKSMKTPISIEMKLTKDEEGKSVDNTKYREDPKTSHLEAVKCIFRYIKGTTHLGLWYHKGSDIETIVYANSDHAGDYVDQKSTSGIYTFMGCCLTSWFLKKQTALSISTTEAEYVSAGKACQQALWMKQALVDYGIRLDDIPIMCWVLATIDQLITSTQRKR
ncbi:hypothetical protein Tco_0432588 [Tanacetum coccineum]